MLCRSEKRWTTAEAAPEAADGIAADYGFSKAMARALVARGLTDRAEIDKFLQPRLADLTDPFALPGTEKAVDLILSHIEQGSSILVYGDYDVDGVTATALMIQVLSGLGAMAVPFLPHRIEDGYGLGVETLHRCVETYHPNLIITVDCGTSSVEAVKEAARLGIDVVVTDHHEPAAEGVAEACAIVNPKLGGCPEDIRMLAGVGVAFKVCHGLVKVGAPAQDGGGGEAGPQGLHGTGGGGHGGRHRAAAEGKPHPRLSRTEAAERDQVGGPAHADRGGGHHRARWTPTTSDS